MSVRILAIDTTTEACSVALMMDHELLIENFLIAPRKHTQHILPMIDNLLSVAGITLNNLDALAFSRGPGSFIGVRINVGIAQGLALGANLPLIGVSTLATLAEGAWRRTNAYQVLTAIDARMGEVYWASYQRKKNVWIGDNNETVISPDKLRLLCNNLTGCWATAGTGWKRYPTLLKNEGLQLISGETLFPVAKDMLPIALQHYHYGNMQTAALAQPVYLRDLAWKKNID